MYTQKCKETITHLERLQKEIWMVESSLVEKDVKLNEIVRSHLFNARVQVQLAELYIHQTLNDPKYFQIIPEEITLPSIAELNKHFKDNFYTIGNQLVPNKSRPTIFDYISSL